MPPEDGTASLGVLLTFGNPAVKLHLMMSFYLSLADFGLVTGTPEISYLQCIDMNLETLGASSEPGRSSSVLVFATMCCSREDTHTGLPSEWSCYDSSSLRALLLLSFMTVFGIAIVYVFVCRTLR